MKKIFLFLSLSLAGILSVQAQSAEEVARQYWELLADGKFAESCKLFDPQAIKDFREMMRFYEMAPEDEINPFLATYFGEDATQESVKKLSDLEFFQSFMANSMSALGATASFKQMEVLGSVAEGADTSHVLTRMTIEVNELEVEQVQVVSLHKNGESWGILLEGKMKGMAKQFQKIFGEEEEEE